MIIEKSPFYNKKIDLRRGNSEKLIEKNQATKISEKEEEFSFWSWFKGLVNPLQNLPLISGIYSSVNSENNESDRDLIQNSLGGFLYGGPFGAIAGFGNWVFNKIFDKTPTELALDATASIGLEKDHQFADVLGYSSCKGLFGLTGASFVAFNSPPSNMINQFNLNIYNHLNKQAYYWIHQ